MECTFQSLTYNKGGKKPGEQKFIKAQLLLSVKGKNGKSYQEDVYGILKYEYHEIRVTAKFREKLQMYLEKYPFEIDERTGRFINLYKCIETFVKNYA